MTLLGSIWREINDPNGGALGPQYLRAVTAGGHAFLGACFAQDMWWAGLAVAVIYWLVKEWGDLGRGGTIRDGLEDTVMVWLGTFYVGPWWWPWLMVGCMAYIMAAGAWRAMK